MSLSEALARPFNSTYGMRRGPRHVDSLMWAEYAPKGPNYKQKLDGTRAEGMAYQRKLTKHIRGRSQRQGFLHSTIHRAEQWIRYEDANGLGWAQPDLLVFFPDLVVIIECKRTHNEVGKEQLEYLYGPLLQVLHPELPQIWVQAVRNLGLGVGGQLPSAILKLEEILDSDETYFVWHWLGH